MIIIKRGKSPWVTMDIMALMASWICLAFDDVSRVYILGRVLRVMRPMRTLRMLSDINTVLQTVVEALPLFGQVSDFAFKRMNSALKRMNSAFKMMNFGRRAC